MKFLFFIFFILGSFILFSIDADFEADNTEGLLPMIVQFTDLSIDRNTRDIISWEWDFNDDGINDSNEQNPQFTFTEAGYYTISLTVSNGTEYDTETKLDYIVVGEPLEADFEASALEGLIPLEVSFSDLSTGGLPARNRDIISWEWDFDDDGIIDSYEQYPFYTICKQEFIAFL